MAAATSSLLWLLAIGAGVMAGVYFAFSAFVMAALGRIPEAAGAEAMRSINVTILGSAFAPLFFATTLVGLALAILGLARWSDPGSTAITAAGIVYVVGMFAVTVAFNLPLNDALAAADPASPEGRAVWRRYLVDWTRWNHVRTAASALASALSIAAIAVR